MGAQTQGVLTPDDLNETDGRVLDVLQTGRVTPQYVAKQLDVSRTYASERLKRLVEHSHVDRMASGLYELVDDPREDNQHDTDEADLRAELQDALEARDDAQAKADRLEDELQDCREQLQQARADDAPAVDDQLIEHIEHAHAAASRAREGRSVDPGTIVDVVRYLERALEVCDS